MRRPLTDTISVDELKSMYDNGISVEDICNALDISKATVYRYLKGQTNRSSGRCASRIPADAFRAHKPKTVQDMANANALNACLAVEDRTVNLAGAVGKYTVRAAEKCVLCDIGGQYWSLNLMLSPAL